MAASSPAKYNLADRRDPPADSELFFAAWVEHISPVEMTLSVPVTGDIGDQVLVKVDRLGDVRGRVAKLTRTGFVVKISATETERAQLKVKKTGSKKSERARS